ncbi:MAG TPA: DNA translocase FtsK 4TM domain-containing protein, partial [Wenzhouxiangella sp.]
MTKTRTSKKPEPMDEAHSLLLRRIAEAVFLVLMVLALYLMLALVSHSPDDPGWSQDLGGHTIQNVGGPWGAWVADMFLVLFGYMAYGAPLLLALGSLRVLKERSAPATLLEWGVRSGGFVLVVLSGCVLFHLQNGGGIAQSGGVFGAVLGGPMVQAIGYTGSTLINLAFFLAGITLFTGLSWINVMEGLGRWLLTLGAQS